MILSLEKVGTPKSGCGLSTTACHMTVSDPFSTKVRCTNSLTDDFGTENEFKSQSKTKRARSTGFHPPLINYGLSVVGERDAGK